MNLDEIFPEGEGRELVLQNCNTCHSFLRIVRGKIEIGRWQAVKLRHKDRLKALSDERFNSLFTYVSEDFNSAKPEPKLPRWFLEIEGY